MKLESHLLEAQRLLGSGLKLVQLHNNQKRPMGDAWNQAENFITTIDPKATGYGIPLAPNRLCSIDPDNVELAEKGLAALGFDLEDWMNAGVRTCSTRIGSGGRSAYRVVDGLRWLKFSSKETGTVLELRAESKNLQDCCPGVQYLDKEGNPCSQDYDVFTTHYFDDAPELPKALLDWWMKCSTDVEFLREQQTKFFDALGAHAHLSVSSGEGQLAFKSDCRVQFNRETSVESILERHGYTQGHNGRWAPATATGAPAVREIPNKDGLWHSDHASDPLFGTFDAWTAYVVLDHDGDVDAAEAACVDDVLGGFENYEANTHADAVLSAIAVKLGMDAGKLGKEIGFQPDVVTQIIRSTAWEPNKSKFFIMHEGLKILAGNDLGTFSHALFEDMYSHADLEALAKQKATAQAMTPTQIKVFVREVMAAAVNKLGAIVRVNRQFTGVRMDVNPFRTEDEMSVEDGIAALGFQHKRLVGGDYDEAVIADFRQHFPELDSFLDLLVAARFASDRKQAHLWLQAPSNWGKSFMLGCLAHHGLVVETSVSELDKIMAGGPVGKTIADFLRAWVLAIDEFKGVTREVKQLSDSINFAPKGLPTIRAPLYLKVFLSAEDVPSLANSETGVEDQFASRFTHVKVTGRLDSRGLFLASKGSYRWSLINYIAERVNSAVDTYVALGERGASDAADKVVSGFFARFRIDREFERMSEDTICGLTNSFVDWVKSAAERSNLVSVFDGGTGVTTVNERAAASHVEVCDKTGLMFIRSSSKVFDLWLDSEFDKHRRGTVAYKKDKIMNVLGGNSKRRVNGHQTKWLPIFHVGEDVEGEVAGNK